MITSLARILLALVIIVVVLWLLQRIRPRPTYFITKLEYPRPEQISLIEVGDYVNLWPSPNGQSIYVYQEGVTEEKSLLGQLPSKYFDATEHALRKGENYEAIVVEHSGHNIRLEVKLKVPEIPDELV